jgi:hypothetical protein
MARIVVSGFIVIFLSNAGCFEGERILDLSRTCGGWGHNKVVVFVLIIFNQVGAIDLNRLGRFFLSVGDRSRCGPIQLDFVADLLNQRRLLF